MYYSGALDWNVSVEIAKVDLFKKFLRQKLTQLGDGWERKESRIIPDFRLIQLTG